MDKVLFVFGTRPEAIKLCPVVQELRKRPAEFSPVVCVTAQHRDLLDQVLDAFGVRPDYDLDLMKPGQTLLQSTSRILAGLEPVLAAVRPGMIVVQGDTTTTFCGALAGFYQRIPVGHVEAGLRTGDPDQPFPEEINRVMTARLASLHFAATAWAASNLRKEGVPEEAIAVTGNTGIDAVLYVAQGLEQGTLTGGGWPRSSPGRHLIVVTAHRRESFGEGIVSLCEALAGLAERPDVEIVFPVHPNPNVQDPVRRHLAGIPNLHLMEPLGYVQFVDLMRQAAILLTDSGGVQEEGPSLGKPVLVLRSKTERPEAVEAGTARLVGTGARDIVSAASELLDNDCLRRQMSAIHNPYGDGRASGRIADLIHSFQKKKNSL
jgi:UDP-N-acetylglucosamine 2-epimerase (non-hydrolysing)